MTFYFKIGSEYEKVRMNFIPAASPYMKIPQYVENAFDGWMARTLTTEGHLKGQTQLGVDNVNAGVTVTVVPYGTKNFHYPVMMYVPTGGIIDPDARFTTINTNVLNAILRWAWPTLEPSLEGFQDITDVPVEQLKPETIQKHRQGSHLHIPLSARDRDVPKPASNEPLDPNLVSEKNWLHFIEQTMDAHPATRLPSTDPDSRKSIFAKTTKVAEIGMGLLKRDKTHLVQDILNFFREVSHNGEFPIAHAYRTDTGANQQFSDAHRAPGQSESRSYATSSIAHLALAYALKTNLYEDYEFAFKLARQANEFQTGSYYIRDKTFAKDEFQDWVDSNLDELPGIDQFKSDLPVYEEKTIQFIQAWNQLKGQENTKQAVPFEIKRILKSAGDSLDSDPENAVTILRKTRQRLKNELAQSNEDEKKIDELLINNGGFSDFLPLPPLPYAHLEINLTPAPNSYDLEGNAKALEHLKLLRTILQRKMGKNLFEKRLEREVMISFAQLQLWFEEFVFPMVDSEDGLMPSQVRQQFLVSGVRQTGMEGEHPANLLVFGRYPTLRATLAVAEAKLILGEGAQERIKAEENVRGWLEQALKVYGGRKVLDDGTVTFWFGLLSRNLGPTARTRLLTRTHSLVRDPCKES